MFTRMWYKAVRKSRNIDNASLICSNFSCGILSKDVSFALKRHNSKLTECLDSIGTSNSYLISFGAVSGLFKVDAKPQLLIKYV